MPLGVAGDNQQHLEAVPRSKARVIGGERIEIRGPLFGELDGARPDGVEMFERLSQAGEAARGPDGLRRLRPLCTILNQRRKVGFSFLSERGAAVRSACSSLRRNLSSTAVICSRHSRTDQRSAPGLAAA